MGSRTPLATLVALVLATTKADEASSAAARAALARRKGLELYAPQHQIEMVPGTAPVPGTNETARLLEAKAWFEKAVEADPSDATNHAYLGNACVRLDDLEGAERAYARALERDPTNARVLSNWGSAYAKIGNYGRAVELFDQAVKLTPEDGTLAKNRDSADMFLRVEQMAAVVRGQGDVEDPWDFAGFLAGTNYSERGEVAFKMVVETYPDLHESALAHLRAATAARPAGAAHAHVLANTLVAAHMARHPERIRRGAAAPLLDEATAVLNATLNNARSLSVEARRLRPSGGALRVVCVASSERAELTRLRASVKRLGAELTVLGLGQPWRGLGSKVALLAAHLDVSGAAADDLILFLDAYDVLLLPAAAQLRERFTGLEREKQGAVVFNSEVNCAPDPSMRLLYGRPADGAPFRFLNSGIYLGRARDVRSMLAVVAADVEAHHASLGADPYRFDDQRWFNRFAIAFPERVHLDARASFFHTLQDMDASDFDIVDGDLTSRISGAAPMAVHGNGNGITAFHDLSRRLAADLGWPDADAVFTATTSPLG